MPFFKYSDIFTFAYIDRNRRWLVCDVFGTAIEMKNACFARFVAIPVWLAAKTLKSMCVPYKVVRDRRTRKVLDLCRVSETRTRIESCVTELSINIARELLARHAFSHGDNAKSYNYHALSRAADVRMIFANIFQTVGK